MPFSTGKAGKIGPRGCPVLTYNLEKLSNKGERLWSYEENRKFNKQKQLAIRS